MKLLKKYFILFMMVVLLPTVVKAGSISFSQAEKISELSYKFTLSVEDINLNYIDGKINITNGTISKITMASGWVNKTGNNNDFHFYHNGASKGNYTVATIEVAMTGNSRYTIENLKYGLHKCTIDNYNLYYNENGNVVSRAEYNASICSVNTDATLKSLTTSSGNVSPVFDKTLELYNITVPNSVSNLTFYATPNSEKAKVISGTTCSLNVGITVCKITVQAEAGNTKTYSITVTRKNAANNSLSTDASIRDLQVHNATLTKSFNPNTKEYDIKVDKGANYIYFTFIANSNGQKYTSQKCNITPDTKTCTLTITAEDKQTTNSYVFNIIKEGTNNNNANSNSSNNTTTGENATSNVVINENKNNLNNDTNNTSNTNNNNSSNVNNSSSINQATENIGEENNASSSNDKEKNNEEENMTEKAEDTMIIPIINKPVNKDIILTITILIAAVFIGMICGNFIRKHKNKQK